MILLRPVAQSDKDIFEGSSYCLLPEETLHQMIAESIAKEHKGKYFELFAVFKQDCCVGFISFYAYEEKTVSLGPEIKPRHRKQGVGFEAMGEAMERAKQYGFTKASAQIRTDNAPSIALHKKLGFYVQKEYINAKGNSVIWFEKILEAKDKQNGGL